MRLPCVFVRNPTKEEDINVGPTVVKGVREDVYGTIRVIVSRSDSDIELEEQEYFYSGLSDVKLPLKWRGNPCRK